MTTSPVAGITGLILAGGAAQRMQAMRPGTDKGLLPLGDRPLVCWLIDNLRPQVDNLLISANRHLDDYRRFGFPVVTDRLARCPGPLAGIHAALHDCPTPWLAVTACDTPFLPTDWVARLHIALHQSPAPRPPIAFAQDPVRQHPLVALIHRSLLPSLEATLAQADYRVRQWFRQHDALVVRFDDPQPFFNINTPEAWHEAQMRVTSGPGAPR